jgi:ADP-ribose pyrophosphatase YjhB (NUDIX family)
MEESEHPLECLRRELREETGLEIEPLELEGMAMDQYGADPDAPWTLNLYWTARAVGGDSAPADDVSELAWFRADELPPAEELAFRNVAIILAEWRDRIVDT